MALTLVTILPFLIASANAAAQCPGDRPIVSEGSCVSEMDGYVSCIRRTAGERSDLSTSEKSDLEGRVQAEVERLVKVNASIEGVRRVEKNVVSSYSRSGHPEAEIEIAKACLRMATPKRAKRSADAKGAQAKGDRSDFRFRDNYGQMNGDGAHDNSMTILNARPAPRHLTDEDRQLILAVSIPKEAPLTIGAPIGDSEAASYGEEVYLFMKSVGYRNFKINNLSGSVMKRKAPSGQTFAYPANVQLSEGHRGELQHPRPSTALVPSSSRSFHIHAREQGELAVNAARPHARDLVPEAEGTAPRFTSISM